MNGFSKKINLITLVVFIVQLSMTYFSYATEYPSAQPLENLRLDDSAETQIGYSETDGNYVNFIWDDVGFPSEATSGYINFYLEELNKAYNPEIGTTQIERGLSGSTTSLKVNNLNSGTIYYLYGKTYYEYTSNDTTYTSSESMASNKVKFLTDIEIGAYTVGSNQIKIEWDDVWNGANRIDYKLYVSENSSFTNTSPIYITSDDIEPNGPIVVNESTGKLEYTLTVPDSGRVYYVKIAPDVTETILKRNDETETISVSTYILAYTKKMAGADFGTIWSIDWSPVVTGLTGSDIEISYQIYRGYSDSNDLPQYMATVDSTDFYVTLSDNDASSYFIIIALVTKDDEEVYPGITIKSDKIYVKEQEVASNPSAPEIVDGFEKVEGDVIISYEDLLTSNSATILWRVPKDGAGEIDTDVTYDIWLISDSSLIDDPPDSTKIQTSLKMDTSNYIYNGNNLIGYKYELDDLTKNSTYYFKIVAKKTYIEYVDDVLEEVSYTSEPSYKVIITPTEGNINQPIVPGTPPLKIKTTDDAGLEEEITDTTVTIQLKNKWYEKYDTENYKWVTVADEVYSENSENSYYRAVEYDSGVTLNVGCIEYASDLDYNDLYTLSTYKITNIPITANDPDEDPEENLDGEAHNIDITLEDLNPNTTYVIWVMAVRKSVNLISEPSDPIIATTNPVIEGQLETPIAPVINYCFAGDTYVDLAWDFNSDYNYNLKYGTKEDISNTETSVSILPADFEDISYYTIGDLEPDTVYYFWIQAEVESETGEVIQSVWSDSYMVSTEEFTPPDTPLGFGIKNAYDAVTKNSITYEWVSVDNMEYILEIASDISYEDAVEYQISDALEYTVDSLASNKRYYARLYAYNPEKELESEPTGSIIVSTKRSGDDYDSNESTYDVLDGGYIIKNQKVIDGVWNIQIIGVNGDRFIQKVRNDNVLDYELDLSEPPVPADKITLEISNKVFKGLNGLKENLIIITPDLKMEIRPNMLDNSVNSLLASTYNDFNYEISVENNPSDIDTENSHMEFKTSALGVNVKAQDGADLIDAGTFHKGLKINLPIDEKVDYKEDKTMALYCENNSSKWNEMETTIRTDKENEYINFSIPASGNIALGEEEAKYFNDVFYNDYKISLENVSSIHKLKSIVGDEFRPDDFATIAETTKIMLDILDYNYGNDYLNTAVKAGIILSSDKEKPNDECLREKAIAMVVRAYEIKTRKNATYKNNTSVFEDLNKVDSKVIQKVLFGIENGLVVGRGLNLLQPKEPITRMEIIVMLEKMMALAGEI